MVSEIFGGRIKEMLAVKKEGKPVVGTFCVYIPEEIVVAAGGVCVGLCGGSQGSVPDAEKVLPRNICPMVKSAYGFKAGRICPYFQTVDFVYGETTCDAKKKTWELLDRLVPTYVMEIPQMKKRRDRTLWLEEVQEFKTKVEEVCKTTISTEDLARAIRVINDKRRALQRLTRLRASNPAPISGKDALLIEQIAFYDEPVRFAEKVNALCDELDARVKQGEGVMEPSAPRVMVSGTPMALPNWKVHNLLESAGAVVVNEESCISTRYFKDLIAEDKKNMDEQLAVLTDRYMQIDCSCFTPNDERIDQILKEYRQSKAQGILHYSLQFRHTYNIEDSKVISSTTSGWIRRRHRISSAPWGRPSMPGDKRRQWARVIHSLWLYRLVRWTLAGLFIWAGGMKLADPPAFAVIIRDFGLVPGWSVMPIAIGLPVLEIAAAIGLVFDVRGSLAVITGLLGMFIAILGYSNVLRHPGGIFAWKGAGYPTESVK